MVEYLVCGVSIKILVDSDLFFSSLPPPGVLSLLPLSPLQLSIPSPPDLLIHNLPVLRDLRDRSYRGCQMRDV